MGAASRGGQENLRQLVDRTAEIGWSRALFEHTRLAAREGLPSPEDERTADWKYLMSWMPDGIALVLGCGRGVVPLALANCFHTVYAADVSHERTALMAARAKEAGIGNVRPVTTDRGLCLPFRGERFDFVSVGDAGAESIDGMEAGDLIGAVHGLLRPGGAARFSLGNRWGFDYMIGRGGGDGGPRRRGLLAYERILAEAGFTRIRAFAPFPRHVGTPMFYVPLDGRAPMDFFFRNLAMLFDAVSPEVKRSHALEYGVAKLGIRVATCARLAGVARLLVPGFCIFAERPARVPLNA